MAKHTDDQRLELLQGTLDMLILRTLQWGPQHGHGIGQAIRSQSDELLKVETGSLMAQNGMHSGAAVNGVTKSGTNDFHGDLFEFVRN